jgi:hypothetical protein
MQAKKGRPEEIIIKKWLKELETLLKNSDWLHLHRDAGNDS